MRVQKRKRCIYFERAPNLWQNKGPTHRQLEGFVQKIGILGGGQLAQMLSDAGHRMGCQVSVLAESCESPAVQGRSNWVVGASGDGLSDVAGLAQLFSQVDLVCFENEFVNCEVLEQVQKQVAIWNGGKAPRFLPSLECIRTLQDKLSQKQLLAQLGIAHAEFVSISTAEEAEAAAKRWGGSACFKWAQKGYDGKGVFFYRTSPQSAQREQRKKLSVFLEGSARRQARVYAEKCISFRRELAMIGVLSVTGEFTSYPLVISEQKKGVCSRVLGPAKRLGVASRLEKQASEIAEKIARKSSLIGAFGVEFFEDDQGRLLVNEIAPRVHNSGHYTQVGTPVSQFENHLRAVLGQPLGSTQALGLFAMKNILGVEVPALVALPVPVAGPLGQVHWYAKAKSTPQRKLGHINGVVSDSKQLEQLLDEMDSSVQAWQANLKKQKRKKP